MKAGDWFRAWDGERWWFGRCRENTETHFIIQYLAKAAGYRKCTYPKATAAKEIENFLNAVEVL